MSELRSLNVSIHVAFLSKKKREPAVKLSCSWSTIATPCSEIIGLVRQWEVKKVIVFPGTKIFDGYWNRKMGPIEFSDDMAFLADSCGDLNLQLGFRSSWVEKMIGWRKLTNQIACSARWWNSLEHQYSPRNILVTINNLFGWSSWQPKNYLTWQLSSNTFLKQSNQWFNWTRAVSGPVLLNWQQIWHFVPHSTDLTSIWLLQVCYRLVPASLESDVLWL